MNAAALRRLVDRPVGRPRPQRRVRRPAAL